MTSGGHTIQEAQIKQNDLINILKVGGFPLKKWSSNEKKLTNWLPDEVKMIDSTSFFNSQASVAVLGLTWHPDEDYFHFSVENLTLPDKLTKRKVLSLISNYLTHWVGSHPW